jgi:hypothetical protein
LEVFCVAQAAYNKKVKESAIAGGAGAYTLIGGINSASLSQGGEVLDDTAFMDTPDGLKSRLRGLNDCSLSITADYNSADAGQTAIYNAWLNRSEIWFQYLPNGTNGFRFRGVVESFELSGEVAGKEQLSVSIQGDGGLAAV